VYTTTQQKNIWYGHDAGMDIDRKLTRGQQIGGWSPGVWWWLSSCARLGEAASLKFWFLKALIILTLLISKSPLASTSDQRTSLFGIHVSIPYRIDLHYCSNSSSLHSCWPSPTDCDNWECPHIPFHHNLLWLELYVTISVWNLRLG